MTGLPVLFLHGGPGLSSAQEQRLLTPLLNSRGVSFECWNEPSALRPEGDFFVAQDAYTHWLESARRACLQRAFLEGPVHLVAHSFGAMAALFIARTQAEVLAGITLVSPTLDLPGFFSRLERHALDDYKKSDSPKATQLEAFLSAKRTFFDGADRQALSLAIQDPELMGHYWSNAEAMVQYAEAAPPIDGEAFFAVCADFAQKRGWEIDTHPPVQGIPVQVLGGMPLDRVRRYFTRASERSMPGTSHYPHLEDMEGFVSAVLNPRWSSSRDLGSETPAQRRSAQELNA